MTDLQERWELYGKAIQRWGMQSQYRMAQEECAELIVAINHAIRGRSMAGLHEEVADATIMLEQVSFMIGRDQVEQAVSEKLDRLQERLAR